MPEGKSNVAEPPADRLLKFTRVFDAPRELVYQACTESKHINVWMCPNGFHVDSAGGDLRAGGEWHCRIVSPSGDPYPMKGVYQKLVPNEMLVFTHTWVGDDGQPEHWTTVTMRFEDAGADQTKLTFEQSVFRSTESRDNHRGGWTESFDKLEGLLAKLQGKG